MAKRIIECCCCDNDAVVEDAQCPNDVIKQTGYHQDEGYEAFNNWYCPDCYHLSFECN